MNEFLNSRSMVTPGVAGAIVTMLTATLSSQFGLPAKWIAVAFSIIIALLIFFADQAGAVGAKIVAMLLNAAIIFSVSVGTNTSITAAKSQPATQPPFEDLPAQPTPTPFFHPWYGQ